MGVMDILNSYAPRIEQVAQALAPIAQQNQRASNDDLRRKVFGINPGFGQSLYGSLDDSRRLNMYEDEQALKQKKLTALQQLGERMARGEITREQGALQYANITGDYDGIFGVGARAPALLQTVDAYLQGDPEKRRVMELFGKTYDKGVVSDGSDGTVALRGYGQSLGDIGYGEKRGETMGTLAGRAEGDEAQVEAAITAAVEAEKNTAAEGAAESKKIREATEVVALTKQAEEYLDKASGSFIEAGKSFGKRVIGESDEETQANAALKVISGKLVANMPRMEGPQSDKDVQLYIDMAANIADPTVPAADKKVALQALRDLNAKYTQEDPIAANRKAVQDRQKQIGSNPNQRQDLQNLSDEQLLKALLGAE